MAERDSPPALHAHSRIWRTLLLTALAVGALARLPAVTAGYPYLHYVDEGHVLHPVQRTLALGRWDPDENNYPQLPILAIAGASVLQSPLAGVWRGAFTLDAVPDIYIYYDQVDPPQLIIVGRVLSLLLSLGIILLAGLLARRLAGDIAGGIAALAAALLPALVFRGGIVIVDLYATLFVLAALVLLAGVERPDQLRRLAAAGACCGLAAVSKYPAGLVCLVVAAAVLLAPWPWRQRLSGLLIAGAAAVLAAAVAMPALWLEPRGVWGQLAKQNRIYGDMKVGSYWEQAFERMEWDLPALPYAEVGYVFTALALVGFVLLVARRSSRRFGIGYVLFAAALIALYASYAFQAFRNLLSVAALACVAAGVAVAVLGERLGRPRLAALGGALLLVALFGPAAHDYALDRSRLVDSRRQALDWIAASPRAGAPVLILAEAAIPGSELARLAGRVRVAPWEESRRALQRGKPRFFLAPDIVLRNGEPLIPLADREWLLRRYRIRASFGTDQATRVNTYWRGNRLRVWVLERINDRRRRELRGSATTTGGNLEKDRRQPDPGGRGERRR